MHLVTLNAAGHASPGVIAGDSILDLGAAVAILSVAKLIPSGMRGLLEGGDAALDLLMERIGAIIKGPMQVVGYKGGGPAVADMIGGQIPLVIQPVVTFLGQARAGKARILTVLLPRRWELLPDVPAITEFIPSFQKPSGGAGVWGPANLPMPVGSAPQEFAEELVKSKVLFEQLLKGVNLKQ